MDSMGQLLGRAPGPGVGAQPWNRVVWPSPAGVSGMQRPMTPALARSLPAFASGVALISGMAMQMPLDDYRGIQPQPRPRLLEQPDPDESRAWFVEVSWEDYLVNGNAVNYVTSRDYDGQPASTVWVPAEWINLTYSAEEGLDYWVGGTKLRRQDVVHVKRSASRFQPYRGVGVVEQHMEVLGKVADQHTYEREMLNGSAVPSVAIITPNPLLSQDEADEGKKDWLEKYGGPEREPALLPFGTQVIPLSWSPSDAQLVEARQLSLLDTANMLNLDGYWVGAPAGGSLTYRSPGPMFLNLLRRTVGPILEVFEDVWSSAWLPRGHRVRYDRKGVLVDDMQTTVNTMRSATQAGLMTIPEARAYMGLPPELPDDGSSVSSSSPVATVEDTGTVEPTSTDDQARSITVNIHGGADPQATGRQIARLLDDYNRRKGTS